MKKNIKKIARIAVNLIFLRIILAGIDIKELHTNLRQIDKLALKKRLPFEANIYIFGFKQSKFTYI